MSHRMDAIKYPSNPPLRSEVSVLKEELAELQQQMAWLKKQMFGRKTEQTSVIMDGGTQLSLFGDSNNAHMVVPPIQCVSECPKNRASAVLRRSV